MVHIFTSNFLNYGKESTVTFMGNALTLKFGNMSLHSELPDSSALVNTSLEKMSLPVGKRKVIFTVPSLDTPVCEYQIKKMSITLNGCDSDNFEYYVISIDTPFAQERFIKANNITNKVVFLSDYMNKNFLKNSGLMIEELGLFTRSVIICNEKNVVEDIFISKEITEIPNYLLEK